MSTSSQARQTMFSLIEKWQRGGLTKKQFCAQHNVALHSFYYWFKQQEIKESVLQRISEVVDYDLSRDFPSFSTTSVDLQKFTELVQPAAKTYWKDKYVELLEQYSELLSNTVAGHNASKAG